MFDGFFLPDVPHVLAWACVALAVVIQGVSKSGFAGGAGILSVPLMMLVMPVQLAVAALLPLLILCDLNAIYFHRRNKLWRPILAIYVPAIAGILIGAFVWWRIGEDEVKQYAPLLKQFVGVIAILFALYILAKEAALEWVSRFRPGIGAGIVAGVAAGFCSTLAHAAGPIVSLYMFAQGMGKTLFVGTVAWEFTLINLTKLPFYWATGLIHQEVLLFDLMLVPFIPLGSYLGKWMHHRVSERLFNRVIFVLTLAAAWKLIFGS